MELNRFISSLLLTIVLCLHGPQHLQLFHEHNTPLEVSNKCSESKLHFDSSPLLEHESVSDCTFCKNNTLTSEFSTVDIIWMNSSIDETNSNEFDAKKLLFLSCLVSRGPPLV